MPTTTPDDYIWFVVRHVAERSAVERFIVRTQLSNEARQDATPLRFVAYYEPLLKLEIVR
jgi:hypothetical protein